MTATLPPLAEATCLYSLPQAQVQTQALAKAINAYYQERECLVITIMNGGLVFAGMLLPHLTMALQSDYIHVSRYHGENRGSDLIWYKKPHYHLAGRRVLLLDDIFDQGVTMAAVQDYCLQQGAESVEAAVLAVKDLMANGGRESALPKFVALRVPDYYIFGLGMDFKGYYRNAPGIYYFQQGNES